jgi:hypothetical protein
MPISEFFLFYHQMDTETDIEMDIDMDIDKDTDTDMEMDADTNHDYYSRCGPALFFFVVR